MALSVPLSMHLVLAHDDRDIAVGAGWGGGPRSAMGRVGGGGGGVNCSGEVQQNVPLLLLLSKPAQFGENLEPPSKKN